MSLFSDAVLATIPGNGPRERLLVTLRRDSRGGSALVMVQQNFGEGVGWYNQCSVELSPHQVAHLRSALGTMPSCSIRPGLETDTEDGEPAVLRFPGPQSASA